MRFLLLLLSLVLQLNISGFANHNPQENHVIKTLTSENPFFDGRSYELFRYYDPSSGIYLSQDPIGLEGGIGLYAYVHDPNGWVDEYGLRGDPATATHITYMGIDKKTGKPYIGYASMQGQHKGTDVLSYRYGGDFSRFESKPTILHAEYGTHGSNLNNKLNSRPKTRPDLPKVQLPETETPNKPKVVSKHIH